MSETEDLEASVEFCKKCSFSLKNQKDKEIKFDAYDILDDEHALKEPPYGWVFMGSATISLHDVALAQEKEHVYQLTCHGKHGLICLGWVSVVAEVFGPVDVLLSFRFKCFQIRFNFPKHLSDRISNDFLLQESAENSKSTK